MPPSSKLPPPSLTPKGFIPTRESLQALVFIPKTLLWLVLAVCFCLLGMVREQRWEGGQREDAWSVKYKSICCSQTVSVVHQKEPLKIQTLSSEIVKLTNQTLYGSRNCCKLHMLSCVESSHTCLIRTYIFRLRSPSNIYWHYFSQKHAHIPSVCFALNIPPDLGCCSLHVRCQLLPTLYHGKPSEYVLSWASGGVFYYNWTKWHRAAWISIELPEITD